MMFELRSEDDPILKQPTPEFDFENLPDVLTDDMGLAELTDAMLAAMRINNGLGLAAPQVGYSLRIFVMKTTGDLVDEDLICINPTIVQQSEEMTIDQEGCLSFPKLSLNVSRPNEIFVSYYGVEGHILNRWLTGINARCFCHELDHLDGITFDTRVAKLSLRMAKQRRNKLAKQQKRKK